MNAAKPELAHCRKSFKKAIQAQMSEVLNWQRRIFFLTFLYKGKAEEIKQPE